MYPHAGDLSNSPAMIERDYILRMIRPLAFLLGTSVAKILRHKEQGEFETGLRGVDAAFLQALGLPEDVIKRMPASTLIDVVRRTTSMPGDQSMADRLVLLGILLRLQGELYEGTRNLDASYESYVKALWISLAAAENGGPPEVEREIATLRNSLGDYELQPDLLLALCSHFEKQGEFARAEDCLCELQEHGLDASLDQQALAFYERLLQRSDAELEAGNLPRDEVEAGLLRMRDQVAALEAATEP